MVSKDTATGKKMSWLKLGSELESQQCLTSTYGLSRFKAALLKKQQKKTVCVCISFASQSVSLGVISVCVLAREASFLVICWFHGFSAFCLYVCKKKKPEGLQFYLQVALNSIAQHVIGHSALLFVL